MFCVAEVEVERAGSREWLNCTAGNKRSLSSGWSPSAYILPLLTQEMKYQHTRLLLAL